MSVINLPLLPLLKAFGHLSDLDMINLSFCSRRTAHLVKVSHRFTSTSRIRYEVVGESHEIRVNNSTFTICVEPSSSGQVVPERFYGEMDMQGTVLFRGFVMHSFKSAACDQVRFGTIFYDTREDLVVLHEALTEHSLNLHLRPPQLRLGLAPSYILTYPFLKERKRWDMVTISRYIGRDYASSEEMLFLLNDSEYTECLNFYGDVEDGFQYSEGFKLNKINFIDSSWVQMDSIINSTSQEIILHEFSRPTASQLINLLKLWIAKEKMVDLTLLRLAFYSVFHGNPNRFRREVWQGIRLSTLGEARTGNIRRIDGVRARVHLGESEFKIHVM